MTDRRHNSAFTLLELVIVLAVMATILAITAPNLARFIHGRSVREEARRFVAVTRRAAAYAVAHSCRTKVWIGLTAENDENGFEKPRQYGWRLVETFEEDEDDEERTVTTAEGTEITVSPTTTEEELTITFGADGSVSADDDLEITVVAGANPGETAVVLFDEDEGIFVVEDGPEDDGEDDE